MRKHHLIVALTGALAACVDGSTPVPTATPRRIEHQHSSSYARASDGDTIAGE
jgi:hypothetical protein